MACGDRPVESTPSLGDFPAPIWREGMDSPSGMRSHGGRSRGLAPCRPRQAAGWQLIQACQGRHGPSGIHHVKALPSLQRPNRQVANRVYKSDVTGARSYDARAQ